MFPVQLPATEMEPERKIEKLLRAYAKKRRAEASDAFKLHPATRRMLQGEVARRSPKPEEEPESLSLWDIFRERWAVLLAFALIMFFGATLFLPALSKAKNRAPGAMAASKLKQIGVAAQMVAEDNNGKLPATLDELTNQLASRDALTDDVSGKPFVYAAGGEVLSDLKSSNVLAYSPSDKSRTVLFADGSVRRVRKDEFAMLTNQATLAMAEPRVPQAAPVEAPAPATAPALAINGLASGIGGKTLTVTTAPTAVTAGELTIDAGLASSSRPATFGLAKTESTQAVAMFKADLADNFQVNASNSQRYRQLVNKKLPAVLNTFEVQQNGNQIAVVDQDGSVYNGTLHPVPAPAVQNEVAGDRRKEAPPLPGATPSGAAGGLAANISQQQSAAQNYYFRVSGANRSLKQNVVFTGNIMANDAELSQTRSQSQNAPAQTEKFANNVIGQSKAANVNGQQVSQQSIFSNSRITGTVTIDHTNVEINALPVAP